MDAKLAERRGIEPLGIYRGLAVDRAASPTRWASGQCLRGAAVVANATASPIDDIDLWELNEAFAVQVLYCRDRLGHSHGQTLNVNGGSISIGHPYGVSGARLVGHRAHRGQAPRRQTYVVVTMCIGGGMGAAGLFEVC